MKNRYFYYICVCVFTVATLLFACIQDPTTDNPTRKEKQALSIAEAQAFFESQIAQTAITRSGGERKTGGLTPGEFTPQWKNAVTAQNNRIASVDVPILSQYKYRAIRSEFKNGKAKAYTVGVTQKLIVVKSRNSEKIAQYILTLVPDRTYFAKNKGNLCNKFIHNGEKNEFSGLAYYATPDGRTIRINAYVKGKKVRGVYIDYHNVDETKARLKALKQQYAVAFQRAMNVQTRSFGEDDFYDCPFCQDAGCEACQPFYCDVCGGDGCPFCTGEIPPVEIIYCGKCGNPIDNCTCDDVCPICGSDPCMCCPDCFAYPCTCDDSEICPFCGNDPCTCCPDCGSPDCNGECQENIESGGNSGEDDNKKDDDDTTIEYHGIQITGTAEEQQWMKSCLNAIAQSDIGKQILQKISSLNIQIKCVDSIPNYPNAAALAHSDGTIDCTTCPNGVLFEELFHQYQYNTPPTDQLRGNREFEAKCADAIGADEGLNMGSTQEFWDIFRDYMNNPNTENLNKAINTLRNEGYSDNQYPINTAGDMLPHFRSLGLIKN